jgi:hypothetical protein
MTQSPSFEGVFLHALYINKHMRPILGLYTVLTIVLHLDVLSFPMALLPFIPQNEIEVVTPS